MSAEREQFLDEHPGLRDRIRDEVAAWPPMSDEAMALCRAAKLAYLRDIEQREPKTS